MYSKTIVRPRYATRDIVLWAAIFGCVSGIALHLILNNQLVKFAYSAVEALFPPLIQLLLFAPPFVLVVLPFAIFFARRCQRPWAVYLAGHTFGFSSVLGYLISAWFRGPAIGFTLMLWMALLLAVGFLGIGIILGLANLGLRQLNYSTRFRILEQDGTLCWHCGYTVGDPAQSDRCPECGDPTQDRADDYQRGRLLTRKRAHVLAGALFVLLAGTVGWRILNHEVTAAGVLSSIAGADRARKTAMLKLGVREDRLTLVGAWETVGVARPVAGHPDKVLAVCFDPSPRRGQPHMQLQLLARAQFVTWRYGDPVVVCDLSQEQVAYVREHGLPDSLVTAMVEAAESAGWTATLPTPNTFGRFVVVDASDHFPLNQ